MIKYLSLYSENTAINTLRSSDADLRF